jgi:hypothetical protein
MDLIERYLQAVRFWLAGPTRFWLSGTKGKNQNEDIIAELREDIRSRIEEYEASLGRSINEDELVGLLKQVGHPLWVAARYQPQNSLIGPLLFPLYSFLLKIVAACYLVPWFAVRLVLVTFAPPSHHSGGHFLTALGGWASLWTGILILFGAVTLIFAILERVQSAVPALQKWDPRKLPRLSERKDRVPRVESIFSLVFSIFFITWWIALPQYAHYFLDPMRGAITINPVLWKYYLLPVVPMLVLAVQQAVNIFRPDWKWLRALFSLISDVMTLGIVYALYLHRPYLFLDEAAKNAADYARAVPAVNQIIPLILLSIAIGVGIGAIVHLFQTVKEFRRLRSANNSSVIRALALL